MERRKILLGSTGALATALAGCFGSETADDAGNGDEDGNNDDDAGNGDEDGNNGDEDGNNGDEHDEYDDVPGMDGGKFKLDSDAVSIERIERKDDKLSIVATTDVTDLEKLYAELETLADDHEHAAVDLGKLEDEIKTIEWIIEHDDTTVVSLYVDVAWILEHHEGALSDEEFLEKVKETAE